jgi:hypothetical protein
MNFINYELSIKEEEEEEETDINNYRLEKFKQYEKNSIQKGGNYTDKKLDVFFNKSIKSK